VRWWGSGARWNASRRRAFLGRQQAIAIGLAAVDIAVTTWNGRGPGN